jgi:PAS domain S-box-containing protein
MTLTTRLAIAMIALVAVAVSTVGWLSYRSVEQTIPPRVLDRTETHSRLVASDLQSYVSGARGDIASFRSAAALNGLIRARLAGGIDPIDGLSEETWHGRMAERLLAELEAKPAYAQFRIIGVADGGREILRIDRSGPNGAIRIVPDAEMQRKADRPYFRETIKQRANDIYVSALDLNVENGVIETPHVPTLRVGTPLAGPDGKPFGILIINIDMRPAFDRVRSAARRDGGIYIVNRRGDYLLHPDPAREFGSDLGAPTNWPADFPDLATSIGTTQNIARIVPDQAGRPSVVALAPAVLGNAEWVGIIETVPSAVVMAPAAAVQNTSLLVGLIAVLCAAVLALLIARSLTRPIVQLTEAVQGAAGSRKSVIPVDASGETGVLARAFAQVMTESQRAQQTFRESEQLARGIIDTALDAFVQMDEQGVVSDWNTQAEKIFGWTHAEAVGTKLSELIIPFIHRDAHIAGLERFLRTGEARIIGRRFEIEAMRRDGEEIKVELTVTELKRRNGFVFNAFMRDLTDKIAAEDRIRQAEKMEAVGQLTGGIAHDFNNILTVITGTIEILAAAVKDEPQLAAITRMIDEAASRGADLTQHLLAFARKQPLEPRETDVNALIIDTAKLLQRTLGEQIEIESVFEDELCPAIVDPNQLATAILNLALNARDAMPDGGKLIIETGSVTLDETYARTQSDLRPGRYAMIAVSDTGTGIPAADLDKVFNPFFTSKGPGKGTGLGLSMVYGFVKQSAGHIMIYSEEGHGTTIKMYLPPATRTSLAAEPSSMASLVGGHETILVVEDNNLVRNYVLTQLHSLGYVTLDAGSATEALAIVAAGRSFDLLFTDVIMPGLNGRQLANEILKVRPGTRVLFTSGYTENAIIHHGRLDEGVLLLAKPYRKSDMAIMIRKALGD